MNLQMAMAAGALAGAAGLGWFVNGYRLHAEIDRIEAGHADERSAAHAAALKDQSERFLRLQKVADAETIRTQARDAGRRAADVAGNGLLVRADATAQAALDAAIAGECEAAANAARVFANVLGRVEAAGRRMAAAATERGDAGATCEAWGDALKAPDTR